MSASGGGASGSWPRFTFAYVSGSKALEFRASCDEVPGDGRASAATVPRALRDPLHGRELHSVAWIVHPTWHKPGLFVTAAEDTLMRLVRSRPSASGGRGPLGLETLAPVERQ